MSVWPYPQKGEVWQFATGNRYRILSVSADEDRDKERPAALVRGQRIDGQHTVVYGTAKAWHRHAVRREGKHGA